MKGKSFMGLSKNLIFKPEPIKYTKEDEERIDLFFKMLEKNGIACINHPEIEVTEEQIARDIIEGGAEIADYTDYSRKTGIKDLKAYMLKVLQNE